MPQAPTNFFQTLHPSIFDWNTHGLPRVMADEHRIAVLHHMVSCIYSKNRFVAREVSQWLRGLQLASTSYSTCAGLWPVISRPVAAFYLQFQFSLVEGLSAIWRRSFTSADFSGCFFAHCGTSPNRQLWSSGLILCGDPIPLPSTFVVMYMSKTSLDKCKLALSPCVRQLYEQYRILHVWLSVVFCVVALSHQLPLIEFI